MNLVVDLKRDHQRSSGTELMVNIKTTATDVRLGTGGNKFLRSDSFDSGTL